MNKTKTYFVLIPLIFLSCAGNNIYSELFRNFQNLITEPEDITIERVNSIPYASMQVRLGRTQNTLIVLEEVQGEILKWTSSNLVKIYTRNGFIVRFTGLENQLDNVELDKRHPIITGNFSNQAKEFTSFYTFNNPKLFRLPVKTRLKFIKNDQIYILGKTINTKLYEESSLDNLISWKFKNSYWVDDNGDIIKSHQSFTPLNPKIRIKMTKKYKKPD